VPENVCLENRIPRRCQPAGEWTGFEGEEPSETWLKGVRRRGWAGFKGVGAVPCRKNVPMHKKFAVQSDKLVITARQRQKTELGSQALALGVPNSCKPE
jgi:hypothetical protein